MHDPSQRGRFAISTQAALAMAGALALSPAVACAGENPAQAGVAGPASTQSESAATGDAPAPAAAEARPEGLFSAPEPWTQVVANLPKSDPSDTIIGWLSEHGGWGSHRMIIDFSIKVLHVTGEVPFRSFSPTEDFYSPDCDAIPFPLPPGGALEDEEGYECKGDGDCHLVVVHEPTHKLYEMWRANVAGDEFKGGCAVVWDLDRSYSDGRGENCTSADAGGFPVAAMTFTADEVARGSIDHAIRFILPNSRIRKGVYVRPATHASDALHGGPDAPPYGVHLRLRADFPLESLPSDGARVVARAMQKYGMILADGGQVPLTAADDRFTEHKWSEVGVDAESLASVAVTDMEVVDMGEPIKATGDCVRH